MAKANLTQSIQLPEELLKLGSNPAVLEDSVPRATVTKDNEEIAFPATLEVPVGMELPKLQGPSRPAWLDNSDPVAERREEQKRIAAWRAEQATARAERAARAAERLEAIEAAKAELAKTKAQRAKEEAEKQRRETVDIDDAIRSWKSQGSSMTLSDLDRFKARAEKQQRDLRKRLQNLVASEEQTRAELKRLQGTK